MSSKIWNPYLLGDISNFRYGKLPNKQLISENGEYPIFTGYKNSGYYPDFNCDENQLIVVARGVGGTGDVKLTKEKCWLTNLSIEFLLDTKYADKIFLYYYFLKDTLRHLDSGSAQSQITIDDLRRVEISIPDIDTQRRIADILSALDEKIELNCQTNATLETMARELFMSWFINFDPVYAKANGQLPTNLKPEVVNLFPNEFQSTELGDIPLNWEVKTVEDVTERVAMGPFGSSIKVETFVDEGIPIISGQHLRGFMLTDSTYNYISLEHAEKLKKANVYRGDVIFTHAGNIENLAFIPEDSQYSRYVVSQRQFYVRCNSEKVTPTFITFYFQSPEGQHKLLANKSPVGVPSIAQPVTYLRSIKLPIPPKPILDEFERATKPLLQKYQANVHESQTLSNLRDTLLPKLMSGEIDVDNVVVNTEKK